MAKMKLNDAAVRRAKQLIEDGEIREDSDWSEAQPSAQDETRYRDEHGWKAYGEWFLGLDPDEDDDNKGRYTFPYGDFKQVHRAGVIAAKQRAAQNDYAEVERAADELLTLIDRKLGKDE